MTLALPDPADLPRQTDFPDLLRMADGTPVTTAPQWRARRAELVRLVQHYEYGYLPLPPAQPVQIEVLFQDDHWLGGKGVLKEVQLRHTPGAPPCLVMLAAPAHPRQPAPVFVGLNFHGNHTNCIDPRIALTTGWVPASGPGANDNRAGDVGRRAGKLPIPHILERGYAVASVYHGDFRPDQPDLTGIEAFVQHDPRADASTMPGAIALWAWGLMRAIDYLQQEPLVDGERLAVYGHSRNGKASLLTGALDERVKLIIECQSGCSGSAPARTGEAQGMETLAAINRNFPHWFNAHYKTLAADPARLPFDQHALLALCAPRPVLVSSAQGDAWANPPGQFDMARRASAVYRLLGQEGLSADAPPLPDALIHSRVGYALRRGAHNLGSEDWAFFLDFADRWL